MPNFNYQKNNLPRLIAYTLNKILVGNDLLNFLALLRILQNYNYSNMLIMTFGLTVTVMLIITKGYFLMFDVV